jgi:hypothetical protein
MPRKSEKAVDAEDHSEDSDDQSEDLADEEIPPAIEPYSVLGLEKTATEDEIKRAYRMTALKHHPGMHILSILIVILVETCALSWVIKLCLLQRHLLTSHRQSF